MTREQATFWFVVLVGVTAFIWWRTRGDPRPYTPPTETVSSEGYESEWKACAMNLGDARDEAARVKRELDSCKSDMGYGESDLSSCKRKLSDCEDSLEEKCGD